MPADVFGRTNLALPSTWLRLSIPDDPASIDPLATAALASGLPLDLTPSPALWGGKMRGTPAVLACCSSLDYERATDTTHAIDLVQAHLIETLSCIGRDYWDFYFLRFRKTVPEFALAGALEAVEMARQEGHIRFIGLAAAGEAMSTLSMWRLHDAFDAILIEREADLGSLVPLAQERRVGVVTLGRVPERTSLIPVRSADEVPCA